ncbi:ABC transporter permease [Methanosarcina sp. T3]|uniref:ABC transporter permease n=1 Tax=Methanosarcina sp. T3 TaxID=3439062 RepID=UPI003F82D4DF
MKGIESAIWAEFLKMRRSTAFWATFAVVSIMIMMMGLMMFVLKNPVLAKDLGLLSVKAQLFGAADWPSFFTIFSESMPGMEMVIFGFVSSWVFGREYSDHTAKDLLALPVSRTSIVISKFIVILIWCVILYLFAFALAIIAGNVIQLSGWSFGHVFDRFIVLFEVAFLAVFLDMTVALIASYTRGYLAAIGFIIFAVVIVNFALTLGYGQYYPWAIAMLYATEGMEGQLSATSWIIVFITGSIGFFGTLAWWRYADQT